jgi:NifB/MoaA-like Fe-S oxidoreductase
MLRRGEDVFLDDTPLCSLAERLGVPVRVVESDGADLFRAMLGH